MQTVPEYPAVEVRGLTKHFGDVTAVNDQSFSITKGEFISLVGPSGCGKTTLLRMLAGLETPDSGEIRFKGVQVYASARRINLPPEQRRIGMVFQDFALWPHMTVFENVAFPLRARGKTENLAGKVEWALETVRLQGYGSRYPSQLSGGQQQRVAFARAIMGNPRLILLDEPLSALDAVLRDQLRELLAGITKQLDLTAVYVTHDQEEALSISDRVFVMNQGEILQSGAPEDVYHRPQHEFVARFMGKSNFVSPAVHPEIGHSDALRMFRPEYLHLQRESKKDIEMKAEVQAVAYHGDRYELTLEGPDKARWYAFSGTRLQVGETIPVYLNSSRLYSLPL